MIERTIPSSGEKIPIIGLGTWIKFDISPNDEASVQNINSLLEDYHSKGGRLIDTSPMYGKAEEVIGKITNGSNKFFYATKVWTTGKESGIRQMNYSLKKLQCNTIDLIQIHNLVDYQTHLKTLRQWKDEKKIRYIGLTHYQSSEHSTLETLLKKEKPDFVQLNYSINERHAERSLLRTAEELGVAVIINEPFDKGRLFLKTHNKKLPDWAIESGINSWAEFFLKYILSDPAVTCAIPATSNLNHLDEIIAAGKGKLPDNNLRIKMATYFDSIS